MFQPTTQNKVDDHDALLDRAFEGVVFSRDIGHTLSTLAAGMGSKLSYDIDGVWDCLVPEDDETSRRVPMGGNPPLYLKISRKDIYGPKGLLKAYSDECDWTNFDIAATSLIKVFNTQFFRVCPAHLSERKLLSLTECMRHQYGECLPRALCVQILWKENFKDEKSYLMNGWTFDQSEKQNEHNAHSFAICQFGLKGFYVIDPSEDAPLKVIGIHRRPRLESGTTLDLEVVNGSQVYSVMW